MNKNKIIKYTEYENKIYMPNEIFQDLKVLHSKGSSHVAFTYSYYFLISWLYRYAKYWDYQIDVKMIKRMLGYNENNKKINYIIKKDGFLDEIGYTRTNSNFPVAYEYKDDLEFTMLSDLDKEVQAEIINQKGRNFKIKVPLKGIWRDSESERNRDWNGTFFQIDYTHEMRMDLFEFCMNDKQLGVNAFYLYGYLKYRCDKYDYYQVSMERLGEEIGMSRSTVYRYLNKLISNEIVQYEENGCVFIEGEYKKEANSYTV